MPKQFVPSTWNPATQMWEQESTDLYGQSEPFLATFPKEGIMRDGRLSQPQTQVPRTAETGFLSLLPTPATSDRALLRSPTLSDTKTPDRSGLRAAKGHQTNLADQIEARFGSSAPLLQTPTAIPFTSRSGNRYNEQGLRGQAAEMESGWGQYGKAIELWEKVTERWAPAPTEPNRNNRPRLAATFPEWMMGWPRGWVTDPEIGLSRSAQLKIIGNGVCPQQALVALHKLLEME